MRTIRVVDPDPRWPRAFQALRGGIERRLAGLDVSVHHVGSTAVPGLAAKPKIDIDALVAPGDLPEAVDRFRHGSRFACHGTPFCDGMWVFTRDGRRLGVRLYLSAPDCPTHRRRILFRDSLRADPALAEAYAALKRRLSAEAGGDVELYTAGKAAFVEAVVERARPACHAPRWP